VLIVVRACGFWHRRTSLRQSGGEVEVDGSLYTNL